jgi:dienelactone hydrolase
MTGRRPIGLAIAAAALLAGCASYPTAAQPAHQHASRTSSAAARVTAAGRRTTSRAKIGAWHSYWVGWRARVYTEPAHLGPTGEHLPARRLLTQLRYPLAGAPATRPGPARGPFPLIVFAPGFMQCGRPYGQLLRYLASAGYVVAVVNFPHSDCLVGAAATEADLPNQPADMSYVITRLLALSRSSHGLLAGLINPRQIAVAGQSDGGDTVAAVAANTCCVDHRVVAVAVESGSAWPSMNGRWYTRHPVPILFSQGSADTINPPGCSVQMYHADKSKARYYLDLLGASHTEPYWGTNRYEQVVARVTLAFFDRYLLGQAGAAQRMRTLGQVPGLATWHSAGRGRFGAGACS